MDLINGRLFCSEINQVLILQLDPLAKYLPNGANYDTSFATVPDGVPSN